MIRKSGSRFSEKINAPTINCGGSTGPPAFFRGQTMRNIATLAFAMLVFGATVERSHAEEMPNLKDPTMISAGHALFLEKQCAHCHGEDGAGGVNLTRRVLDAKGVFVKILIRTLDRPGLLSLQAESVRASLDLTI
jgi:hypothetical protein